MTIQEKESSHGKVRVTIWRFRVRVRVIWVTVWYLNMNYLPG